MNKKGVSPVIATLLLIVIAVAAAVVTYTFVMGFVGTSTASASTAQGQLTYDAYKVEGTYGNANITIYLRNIGGKAVTVNAVYVAGTAYTNNQTVNNTTQLQPSSNQWMLANTSGYNSTLTIDVGETKMLFITSGAINPAQLNEVKIVCTDGTTLSLSVRK
ncbi:MAG: type IV pilin [Candidatus Verstraetearchaeota archaeon]|nr:type IV pilin [Candidatus Verstraetearchaeota archaeon]